MRKRLIIGLMAVLVCIAGMWLVRRPGHPSVEGGKPLSSVPVASSVSAGTLPAALTVPATNTVASGVRSVDGYRLSNTATPLNQLLQRDTALLLENARWDTTQPLALNIPAHLRAPGDPGAYLIQNRGPVDAAFQAKLLAAGVTPVSYIPNNAWLVRATQVQAAALAAQPGIQAAVPFEPYYKVKSSLLPLAVEQEPLPAGECLNLVLFADAEEATTESVKQLGVTLMAKGRSPFGPVLTVMPSADSLVALAGLSGVQIIELAAPRVPANDLSRVRMSVAVNTLAADNYFGLTGTNVVVGLTDSGVDVTHLDLTGRVWTNSFLAGEDAAGHGTFVAGVIAGSGSQSSSLTNVPGSLPGADFRGKAPGATLFSISLGDAPTLGLDFDSYAQEQTVRTNALISNNSWTLQGNYDYDITAASYDAAVRDALPLEPGSQPLLFVFAAGNNGGGTVQGLGGIAGSITSPGTSKNSITVGALEQLRDITNEVVIGSITNAVWSALTDSDDEVANYSARGNVGIGVEGEFGRFKPDVVAPGTFVVSARSSQWDTNAYYSITNRQSNTFADQEVAAGGLNQYSIFIPPDAVGLVITVTPGETTGGAVTNFPIYVSTTGAPTLADVPAGTNIYTTAPTAYANYFYAIGNPNPKAALCDVTTTLITTNNLADYYRVLREMNDGLGGKYRYESGTSFAAPGVSGVLALMQEFFEQRLGRTNSPALMKALLINGARSSSSIYDMQVRNSVNHQGWGLVNLPTSLPSTTNAPVGDASFLYYDQDATNALATGQSRTRTVTLTGTAQERPLRFTLVWTDPPGNPAAGIKLVNDLDIVVTNLDTKEVFFGNDIPANSDFNAAYDTNGVPVIDSINNVENVYLAEPLGTNFTVTVSARRVNVNAVTAHTNNVVQDYALVISSGDGEVTNSFTVATGTFATNRIDNVTTMTNTAGLSLPLLNQLVGANSPLVGTTSGIALNGVTNQWHFYVSTNYGTNINYTNAAFITFMPPTLAVPRMGVRAGITDEISRPEADIDMFVSTNAALTNLDSAVLAGAFRSVGRGGTEVVVLSNSLPGRVYYIGVKSEDQMAAEYGFFSVFSDVPFSQSDSNGIALRGVPVPAVIPDGSNAKPGAVLVFGIAIDPVKVRRVTATNTITHEDFGDLLVNLSHNRKPVVLHNHSFGNGDLTQTFVFDDGGEALSAGIRKPDGPGSLTDFMGEEAIGLWLLTVLDDAPSATGRVDNLTIRITPQNIEDGDTFDVQPYSWGYDFVEVPPEATNLTVTLINNSANPLPLDLYIRRGSLPTFTEYDKKATITPPGGTLSVSKYDVPPLQAGTYYIGVYNPNAIVQNVTVKATLEIDLSGVVPVGFASTNTLPLRDDAVTRSYLNVTDDRRIVSLDVGVRINHPRVSDLALTLVSPEGKRILLFENRGWETTNGLGDGNMFDSSNLNFIINGGFELGAAGWTVTSGISISNAFGYIVPSEGTNFAIIGDFDIPNSSISQSFSVLPGTTYKLMFDQSGWGDPGLTSILNVSVSDPSIGVLVSTNYTKPILDRNEIVYSSESIDFTVPTGVSNVTVQFLDVSPSGGRAVASTIDRVSVNASSVSGNYLTFTENTNLTTTPIKFALPPFVSAWTAPPTPPNNVVIVAGPVQNPANGHHYYVLGSNTWDGAESWAVALGGHLATINDANENAWMFANLISTELDRDPWIGLMAPNYSGPWTWVSGELVTHLPWAPGEPNGIGVPPYGANVFSVNTLWPGQWNDAPTTDVIEGIAEIPSTNTTAFYLPEESLADLKGDQAQGIWTLEVWDNRVGATNLAPELVSWNLSFTFLDNVSLPLVMEHGVTVTNTLPPRAIQILAVDVPIWATAATNSLLSADLPVLVWFNQNIAPTGTNASDLNFLGGAVTGGTRTIITNGVPPLLPGRRYYLGVQNTNAVPVTYVYRVDFDITPLANGVPVTAVTSGNGFPRYFSYNVSSNATAAMFKLSGMDGDLNLVARRGSPLPTLNSYDLGSFNTGVSDEQILVFTNGAPVALTPGQWYLGVFNTTANPVNYTIQATEFTNAFPQIITLINGVPYAATNSGGTDATNYYRYVVTSSAARAQFETFAATANLTLVASKGLPLPDLGTHDYLSSNGGTNDEQIVVFTNSAPVMLSAGDWFITAVNVSGQPVSYTIQAMEWEQTGRPITISDIDTSFGDFCIRWASLPGVHYVVQSSTNLALPVWFDASPTITAYDYTTTWCTLMSGPLSFFRVVEGVALSAVPAEVSITGIVVGPGGVTLTWNAPATATFQVQWTSSLSSPNWQTIPTIVTSTTGVFTFTDDGSQTGGLGSLRFYRLLQQ